VRKEYLTQAHRERTISSMSNAKTEFVTVRFTPEERAMTRKAALEAGLSESEYVRVCVMMDRGLNFDPVAWSIVKRNIMREIDGVIRKGRAIKARA
jgi:hypothetical protein